MGEEEGNGTRGMRAWTTILVKRKRGRHTRGGRGWKKRKGQGKKKIHLLPRENEGSKGTSKERYDAQYKTGEGAS